jgi:hypothetical protein
MRGGGRYIERLRHVTPRVRDPMRKANAVALLPDPVELGAEHGGIGDRRQMRSLRLHVAPQRLDVRLVGGDARAAEVLGDRAQRHELPRRVGGHGRAVVADRQQDRHALVVEVEGDEGLGTQQALLDAGQQSSASRASRNRTRAWVVDSSAESSVAIHFRLTRSTMPKQHGARRQRPKWVTSQSQTWLGRYSTHAGQGLRTRGAGRSRRGSTSP